MNHGIFPVVALALAGVMTTGCGGASDDDALRSAGASEGAAQATIDVRAATEHLYFGPTNHLHLGGDVLTVMDLNAGAVVQLEVATADSSPLRFELWQVHAGTPAEVDLVNAFDVESGFVLTTFSAPSDGKFLVHFPAPASPRDVSLQMNCERTTGRCTSELQPGELCYEQTSCSPGLLCAPNDGACSAIWWGGQCVIPDDDTACAGLPSSPVCGCNGITYGNECLAVASGSGMRTSGACGDDGGV
jgi:hypothetical protein